MERIVRANFARNKEKKKKKKRKKKKEKRKYGLFVQLWVLL